MYNNSISAEMFLQTYVNTYIVSIAQKSTFINVLLLIVSKSYFFHVTNLIYIPGPNMTKIGSDVILKKNS